MADNYVTSPIGQQMAQSAQQGEQQLQSQPPPGEGDPNPSNVQALQQQQDDAVASGSGDQPRPKGTIADQRAAIRQKDPNAKLPPTPTQQAEYTQLVTRFMLFIYDTRQNKGMKSPAQGFIDQMNNPKLSIPQAVGFATANAIFILHDSAKRQKVEYSPVVLFHAADECLVAMYLLGLARGIFQGVPPFKGKNPGKPYPFTPQEKKLIMQAKLYAVQQFGRLMLKSGQITPKDQEEARQVWQQKIKQEAAQGKVTDAHVQALLQNPKIREELGSVGPSQNPQDDQDSTDVAPQQPPQQLQQQAPQQPQQQPQQGQQ